MGPLTSIAPPAVQARGIGFHYPSGRRGLSPTDLTVEAGEVVVALGPNGSGKSTLLRILATDLRAQEGTLDILGHDAHRHRRAIRRRIGYAPDSAIHIPWLTGAENGRLFGSLAGLTHGDVTKRMTNLFRLFELMDARTVPVSDYSFGMKRKLLLVETLMPSPPLILLDEPTVGLDPAGISALRGEVQTAAASGAAIVIASNDTRVLPPWADRILFLHQSALVHDAPFSTIVEELRGRTRIEVDVVDALPVADLGEIGQTPGLHEVRATSTGFSAVSTTGGEPLPTVVQSLLSAGIDIRDIRVREPDLGDLFRALTGDELNAETEFR